MNDTISTSSLVTIIFGSEYFLHWNFKIDLLLLIINSIVLNIPLLRFLINKFTLINCIKKNNNKIHVKYHHHKTRKKHNNKESFNVQIDFDGRIPVSNNHQTNDPQRERKTFIVEKGNDSTISEDSYSNDSILKHRKIQEIITQLCYFLLLLAYLAYLFEILILRISIRTKFLLNNKLTLHNVISIELIANILTIIVHLVQYGFFYGQYLWLDWTRVDWLIFRKRLHHSGCFLIILHLITFSYFFLSTFCNGIKLVIIGILLKNHKNKLIILLRPYILLIIVLLQLYFSLRHLIYLIEISNQFKHVDFNHSTRISYRSSSNKEIKYQRNESTFLSMITFYWFIPILKIGYHKNLDLKDLGSLPINERSITQFQRFFQHYKTIDIKKYKSTFLWRVCWRTYKKSLIFGAIIKICSDLSSLIGPISISNILEYISNVQNNSTNNTPNKWRVIFVINENQNLDYLSLEEFFNNAYVMTIIVLITTILQSTFSNNFNHLVISEGIHLKSALSCCIYKKALKMPINNAGYDSGVISNYLAIDSSNIFQFFTMMHYLWAVPIKIIILLCLLYKQMGISAICGATIFFISLPFQYYCSRQISIIQKLQLNITDKRISKTTELFMGIKLLKLMGWELSFAEQVEKFRKIELDYLRRDAIFVAINTFITQASAILVTMFTFILFTYIEDKPLKASTVFTSMALFNQITVPLYIVPLVIPMLISAIVSHKRLVDYFSIGDVHNKTIRWNQGPIYNSDLNVPNSAPIIANSNHQLLNRCKSALSTRPSSSSSSSMNLCCFIKNGNFSWYDDVSMDECTLNDINLHIPRGKLTILVGSIGSGKSTLLASLIGETFLVKGELHWLKENEISFGYVPSTPWILNVSLQENITFGKAFDQKRYQEVIKACCLQVDIDLLPKGDQTIIGERGITLSGGQRQRIALARAIYSSAPTLILDDAISALDPIVGYSVFENAIIKLAIKHQKRTVILATHKQEFLSRTDHVLVIESGTIKNQGTLEQVEKENKAFFYHRNVIKEKETHERLKQKLGICKTTEERNQLARIISKKGEFRGPTENQGVVYKSTLKKNLCRQVSCDITHTLPCHEWTELEDVLTESDSPMLTSLTTLSESRSKSQHLSSFDSCTSINSFNETINLNCISNNNHKISAQTKILEHRTVERLNSHLSNCSYGIDYDMEEEYETKPEIDQLSLNSKSTIINDSDSDVSDDSMFEDACNEVTEELLHEINSFNENQMETSTLHNLDIDPRKNHISLNVLSAYINAHSYKRATIVFILIILNQTFRVVSDFWLANWTDQDEHRLETDSSISIYIQAYIILSIISVVISLATNVFAQLISIKAVHQLHDKLLSTLVRCPLRFFDKTPIGRIVNRFTNDVNIIDKKLPIAIPVLLRFVFLCVSAIVVNIIISPYFVIVIIPILIAYYYLQKIFRCTSRQLQRLESSSKSPIISHFNQTTDGLITIRAFNEQSMFTEKFFQLLDANNLCFLMVNSANCFLGITLDYFGGVILFLAMLTSITAALYWNVQSAFVGLAITYTLLVPVYLNWLVRNLAQVEMNMNSVERIYNYSQLEVEESCTNSLKDYGKVIPENWLQRGEVEFKKVTIRYGANLEPIIHDASIHIKPGEKIGICGRTGSGKSSLIGALFRINQISNGQILIDGFDITHICPYRLRKKLAIIPQDLVLFTGSIRDNLDPYREHTDEELWRILKDFRLDRTITSLDEEIGNDSMVTIEQRFSSGQRQLLCCARAFLRNSPILFMDESTSLLDRKSELLVIEQIFKSQKTIIAIAHRVWNISNFDKVAVVNNGRIVEFDTPHRLLLDTDSLFYSLYHKNSVYRR